MTWAVTFDRASNLGIYNPRRIGGTNAWSTHAEGRAIDVGFPVARHGWPAGHELADTLVQHHAELGVQQVIWARRVWRNTIGTWRNYSGRSAHLDHVHAELTRQAAAELTPAIIAAAVEEADPMIPEEIVASYLRGGREPTAQEVHTWTIDCTRKRENGDDLAPTYRFIEYAVSQETRTNNEAR